MGATETSGTAREPAARGVGREWARTWLRALLAHRRGSALARWVAVASLVGCTAPLTVDRLDDEPTASACVEGVPDDCSLRGAILNANRTAGKATVVVPAGTYTLTVTDAIPNSDEDLGETGDLDVTDDLDLVGTVGTDGPTTIVNQRATDNQRVFHLDPDRTPGRLVSLWGLVIRGGTFAQNPGGSGLLIGAGTTVVDSCQIGPNLAGWGGGVVNSGDLFVTRTRIVDNQTISGGSGLSNGAYGDPGTPAGVVTIEDSAIERNTFFAVFAHPWAGGGIWNGPGGDIRIERTTVARNTLVAPAPTFPPSQTPPDGVPLEGGGVANEGTLYVADSAIHDNSVATDDLALGGGISNRGSLVAVNTTIARNVAYSEDAPGQGQGLYNTGSVVLDHVTFSANGLDPSSNVAVWSDSGQVELTNTLVDGWCVGAELRSLGGNLETPDDTCGLDAPSDHPAEADARLGPLAPNGGTTQTVALLAGSPAVDAGVAEGCLPADQRGQPRTDGRCDTGAFERQAADP